MRARARVRLTPDMLIHAEAPKSDNLMIKVRNMIQVILENAIKVASLFSFPPWDTVASIFAEPFVLTHTKPAVWKSNIPKLSV